MPTQFSSNSDFEDDEDAEFFSSESNDELDEFVLDDDEDEPDYPWLALWEMAEHYYDGDDDYIQDYEEAMKLYKQAIKLGCLPAYYKIGEMYRNGEGVSESSKKALEWFKEGVKKGNYYCYDGMANIFVSNGQYDNFHKCFSLLFKNRNEYSDCIIEEFKGLPFYYYNFSYIFLSFLKGIIPLVEVVENENLESKNYIISEFNQMIEIERHKQNSKICATFNTALKWTEENL